MREGEPSRTAFGAAVHRAAHADLDRPVVFEDPLAWRILGVDREAVLADVPPLSRLRFFVAVRHRFAEDVVAEAVARGARQVVVLGAGLDTFAYRQPARRGCASTRSTSRPPVRGSGSGSPRRGSRSRTR